MSLNLVDVRNLKKHFPVQKGFLEVMLTRRRDHVKAVDGVSFNIRRGEVFALAGESGCGKTTTGRLILRLVDPTEGKIFFDGNDITSLEGEELRRFRRRMQLIFQDPYASLNPRMRVGDNVGHPLEIHGVAKGEEKKERVLKTLERVGLVPAEAFYETYPHLLSGGQRQRVAIARAIILGPKFIVADEPVSMIDVSVRAFILDLMMDLKRELDLTYLFITHDLAVTKYISDRIAIMYLGKIVELGSREKVFSNPQHHYTTALLSAIPVPNPKLKRRHLIPKGEIPSPINPPSGCRFHPRCPYAVKKCSMEEPQLEEFEREHRVACFRPMSAL